MQTLEFGVHLDAGGGGGAHVRLPSRWTQTCAVYIFVMLINFERRLAHLFTVQAGARGMLLNNRRPASFRPPARNRNRRLIK